MADLGQYTWHTRCNAPRTWRQRLAGMLHSLAMKIDGRLVLAIEFAAEPEISRRQRVHIARAGVHAMNQLLRAELRQEAIERVLRHERPELFKVSADGQDE